MSHRKSLLAILDGWGIGKNPEKDAIASATTPYYDYLISQYPNATLTTYGSEVGLPDGQMGNSEVGHLNIGAGRIVYQELARINKAIKEDTLATMPALKEVIDYAKDNHKKVHLLGLLSDGGVHAHIDHFKAMCNILEKANVPEVYIHAFMDGRDTDPKGGVKYVQELLEHTANTSIRMASMIGRYYAMDRDLRWDRIKLAYDLLVNGIGESFDDPIEALQKSYDSGKTDEFVAPIVLDEKGIIQKGDAVIFLNFRTDRPRQILRALTQEDFQEYDMTTIPLHMVTMVNYDQSFQGIHVIYSKENLSETMGEVVSSHGLRQIRIAETEKYPHVTFFFNGGRETPFEGEERIVVPSPKVATYDLAPEMSAEEITNRICAEIQNNAPDFICLNYANADMVGHTGDFNAAQKACEVVDQNLKKLVTSALKEDYEIIVIADHGNSDKMINEDGSPHTAHTLNPVPIIYVSNEKEDKTIVDGKLADVAPTLLFLMGLKTSNLMTGEQLIRSQ